MAECLATPALVASQRPMPASRVGKWWERVADRWVRWREARHQRSSEGIPSPEAIDEATEYYAGLYHGKSPDPALFSRLIRRRGIPNWPNPYAVSDPEYYDLHPDGFLWADVQALAEDMLFGPRNDDDANDNRLPAEHIDKAQLCWMMVLQETSGQWPSSLLQVHPDNLAAITMQAFLNPNLSLWGVRPQQWQHLDLVL